MAIHQPQSFEEVLASEYAAVRPGAPASDRAMRALTDRIHHDANPLTALCISGGGIRSATFALGAIQGFAERGLLRHVDYLSTVSGGGYVGGWLTAWVQRANGGIEEVMGRLRRDAPPPAPGEPDPIQHLRDYNSYLSPRLGAASTDTWTLVAIVLRNILLNWLVLVPLLMAVLMIPRLYVSALSFPELFFLTFPPQYGAPVLDAVSKSVFVDGVTPVLTLALFAIALFNILRFLPGIGARTHSRYDYVVQVLVPLVGAVFTFLAFDSLYFLGTRFVERDRLGEVVLWTALPSVVAFAAYLLVHRGSFRHKLRVLFGPLTLGVLTMAVGTGAASWVTTNFVLPTLSWAEYVTVGPPLILLGFILGTVLFVGVTSTFLNGEDREWMSRAVAGVLLFAVAWALVCALVLLLPAVLLSWRIWGPGVIAAGGAIAAWLSTSQRGSPADSAASAAKPGLGSRVLSALIGFAPAIFVAFLIAALSMLTDLLLHAVRRPLPPVWTKAWHWFDGSPMVTQSQPVVLGLVTVGFAAVSWVMARYVNINTFSLHDMYRDRIVRAYLGASNATRKENPFTGFSDSDDVRMAAIDTARRPFHVVNLTLNLTAGERLAWQQRKAASFTVSPLHSGSADLGYRSSAGYGGGITLGTAVAISGAAASPAMGYHSSPIVGFIMTLFNARLGAWLGNPGARGRRTWKQPGPLSAARSLTKEALGQASAQSEYVYLSDGGHFENLALYEMVRRRCRTIVLLDGGCDPHFHYDDLGNALRKIRIDLRIPIEFSDDQLRALRDHARRYAVGKVKYSVVDGTGVADGTILYVKPMLLGSESPDVASYAASHPEFPHEPTADQWFNESQTESYRALGLRTVDDLYRGLAGDIESPAALIAHLEDSAAPAASPR